MMHPLFHYIIIGVSFFIEYDFCFPYYSYIHAFKWYNRQYMAYATLTF